MKKIIVLLLLIAGAMPVCAQSRDAEAGVHEAIALIFGNKENKKLSQKIEQTVVDVQAVQDAQKGPVVKMDKSEFYTVQEPMVVYEEGQKVYERYSFLPNGKPLIYKEIVSFTSSLPEADYEVIDRARASGLVGPLSWREVDFEVTGIEVIVYEKDRFDEIVKLWKGGFGKECVYETMEKINAPATQDHSTYFDENNLPNNVAGIWKTPTKVYRLPDGKTVVVKVFADSKYGPYKRACSRWGQGVLFKHQPQINQIGVVNFAAVE